MSKTIIFKVDDVFFKVFENYRIENGLNRSSAARNLLYEALDYKASPTRELKTLVRVSLSPNLKNLLSKVSYHLDLSISSIINSAIDSYFNYKLRDFKFNFGGKTITFSFYLEAENRPRLANTGIYNKSTGKLKSDITNEVIGCYLMTLDLPDEIYDLLVEYIDDDHDDSTFEDRLEENFKEGEDIFRCLD